MKLWGLFWQFLCCFLLCAQVTFGVEGLSESEELGRCLVEGHRPSEPTKGRPKWLVVSYIVCDYKLNALLWNNIRQMARIGSNENITIVVQVHEPDTKRATQRYLIERGRAVLLNPNDVAAGKQIDGGSAESLRDFMISSIKQYPADHVCVILSNHGSGIIDPISPKKITPNELYQFDPNELLVELKCDLSETFFDNSYDRGICFDSEFDSYLSYEKLSRAFRECYQATGKRINIVGMDACLMQMFEINHLFHRCGTTKDMVDIVVASQEVEPGPGWDYELVLQPFKDRSLTPDEFARHIVNCYTTTYAPIAKDYTLSAVSLKKTPLLEDNLHQVAQLLSRIMQHPDAGPLVRALHLARSTYNLTYFLDKNYGYVDLGHFYKNLLEFVDRVQLKQTEMLALRADLTALLREGIKIIQSMVFANTMGKNRSQATGLSIYFPPSRIHPSYYSTYLAASNHWIRFLEQYTNDRDLI